MNISRLISLIVFFMRRHGRGQACWRLAACVTLAVALASSQPALAVVVKTIVRMETNLGSFNIGLYDDDAPETVKNFLNYVNRGDYDNSIIHRSVPGFVVQGGGYKCCDIFGQAYHILTDPPVLNEFDPSRSNIRGTIAMAKLGDDPDSATSEWFFNLADNHDNLDNQNGGFTVFAHVLDAGMDVVDAIAVLPIISVPGFSDLPVLNNNYVKVNRACINNDGDGVCTATENLAPSGDGNADGTADSEQAYVATILTTLGGTATFSADVAMKFNSVGTINKNTALAWLKTFTSPPDQSVHFNNGIFTFSMTGVTGTANRVVTLYDGAATRPTRYYAYGKTLDNPTDHWYDFSYDSATGTGAEIVGDKIILHFVDGKRGDEDLKEDNSITHTGAQAVVTSTSSTDAQSGGCSIASTPSQTMRGGDWIVVSLFLAFVAFVRKRTHRQRF